MANPEAILNCCQKGMHSLSSEYDRPRFGWVVSCWVDKRSVAAWTLGDLNNHFADSDH